MYTFSGIPGLGDGDGLTLGEFDADGDGLGDSELETLGLIEGDTDTLTLGELLVLIE